MKVFVTGGSGFVGGHVIERLVRDGHEVSAMARSDSAAKTVEAYGAKAVRCSLDDVTAAHLAGVEAVVHTAAYVEDWGPREAYWKANVVGTETMLRVAQEAGAGRFVHIGTEAMFFVGEDLLEIDETLKAPREQVFLYSETKAEAEARVLAANAEGFTTISLRPRLVWGPRDASVLPAILEMAKKGAFVWIDGGAQTTSTCHVANLCEAVSLALTKGVGGEAYFIADEGTRTMRGFFTELAATQGVALGGRSLPGAVMRPVASALEAVWRAVGAKAAPPMTKFAISMLSRSITVKTAKAARELGYAPVVSVAEGVAGMRAGG